MALRLVVTVSSFSVRKFLSRSLNLSAIVRLVVTDDGVLAKMIWNSVEIKAGRFVMRPQK